MLEESEFQQCNNENFSEKSVAFMFLSQKPCKQHLKKLLLQGLLKLAKLKSVTFPATLEMHWAAQNIDRSNVLDLSYFWHIPSCCRRKQL